MEGNKYIELYQELRVPIKPLPDNYDPDSYGKMMKSNYDYGNGVLYSSNTSTNQTSSNQIMIH